MRLQSRHSLAILFLLLGIQGLLILGCTGKERPGTADVKERSESRPATENPNVENAPRRPAGEPIALALEKNHTPPDVLPKDLSGIPRSQGDKDSPTAIGSPLGPATSGNATTSERPAPPPGTTNTLREVARLGEGSALREPTATVAKKDAKDTKDASEADVTKDAKHAKHGDAAQVPLTDPVLFADWPDPKAVLVFSGEQHGYLEPCGCAGFDNMKGGLTRRHSFFKELQAKKWPAVGMDVGGQLNPRRHGVQGSLQFENTANSLKAMGYQVIGLGSSELLLPATELIARVSANGDINTLFLSANVGIFGFDSTRLPFVRVLELGGMKIGVTSVIGDAELKEIKADDIERISPAEALQKHALPKLREAKCDRLVLLAYASPEETRNLAKQFPEFQIVVCAGKKSGAEPPAEPSFIADSRSILVEVGHKGSHVVAVGLFDEEKTPFRYQRVPMDRRFKESPEIKQFKLAMQQQLEELEKLGQNPDIKPQAHPRGGAFVGSAACADCHTAATKVFEKTPHAHAFDTLANLDPPRIHDPECLSCHVTGWNPQEFFPYVSGFVNKEKTPDLLHNGCENCHGPGKAHVDLENDPAASPKKQAEARARLRLPLNPEDNRNRCAECHDGDNSPEFQVKFLEYFKKIEHHGRD